VITYLATKDPSVLANLGIAPKKPASKIANQASVTAPKAKATHGKVTGSVVLKSDKVAGSASMEVQFCQGDPLQEGSWSAGEHFPHCSHMEIRGLEPGKMYYFRVRCLGNDGHGPWSAIISLMVI
jgi:phosphodiesterase/alkaline phosphatase D-like protein